ncbi:MAG: 2-oxo acid dehydrogenase subunit E2 [Chloroflexota bacterium]|nr:2-oxo acid dehydrogenase subunit E2 [Chloroflexota bacterium]
MRIEIKMPDLATTDSEVTLLHWLVEPGQTVKLGQPLLEIETDKATMEVESIAAGVLAAVHAQPGERVAVGQLVAVIENELSESATSVVAQPVIAQLDREPLASPAPTPSPMLDGTPRVSLFMSNKARRLQRENMLTLSPIQRDVARRVQEAKQTIPHYYLHTSANAEPMAALRGASKHKLVWDTFFVMAAARALRSFEKMQFRFAGDSLARNPNAIGIAIDVDDELFVMAVDNPLALTLEAMSTQITDHVRRIKHGDPTAKRITPTWLTISNLGGENIESFQAVINPPGAAILSIGKIMPTVVAKGIGQIVIEQRVQLGLAVDHRVINGRYAARFLGQIVHELESL